MRHDSPELSQKIRSAYFWTVVGSSSRYVASVAISLLLARLLSPEDYGLIGMALVATELLGTIYDWSIAPAIVHLYDPQDPGRKPTYFTLAILIGALLTVLIFATAPLIAYFYHEPRLTPVLRAVSFALVIGSVRVVSSSIMARNLQFKSISVVEITASLSAGLVALVLAWRGFGVWSLVANILILNVMQLVGYARYVPPRFTLHLEGTTAARLWRYCLPLAGTGMMGRFYDNSDYLVVGKVMGAAPLGFYSVAFRLAMLMNERVSSVVNKVAFPTFATLKEKPDEVVKHWFAVSKRVTLLTFPLLALLAFNAHDFVRIVLGERWLPAAFPLQFLCVMTGIKILTNIIHQVLTATGYPQVPFPFEVVAAILLPISFYIGCKRAGFLGVAVVWCVVFPAIRFAFLMRVRRLFGFRLVDYARNLIPTAMVTVVCLGVMVISVGMEPGVSRLVIRALLWMGGLGATVMFSPEIRALLLDTFQMVGKPKVRS